MRSSVMANDFSHRAEFKDRLLKRVQSALTDGDKPEMPKLVVNKTVKVRGLEPVQRKEV